MAVLPLEVASTAVSFSLGLYLAVALILVAAPMLDALAGRRRTRSTDLSATLECLGIALAIAGFATGGTGLAAIGVLSTLAVAAWNSGKLYEAFDPAVYTALLVCALVSLGALAEFRYFGT